MGDLFSFGSLNYENATYERLEESVHEYIDDKELIDKLVPDIKKILTKDLDERKSAYERVEGVFKTLFPEEELEVKKPLTLG